VTTIEKTNKVKSGFQSNLLDGNCDTQNPCQILTAAGCGGDPTDDGCFSNPCTDTRDATLKCRKSGLGCGLRSQENTGPCAL